jgi:hypothetical protein
MPVFIHHAIKNIKRKYQKMEVKRRRDGLKRPTLPSYGGL